MIWASLESLTLNGTTWAGQHEKIKLSHQNITSTIQIKDSTTFSTKYVICEVIIVGVEKWQAGVVTNCTDAQTHQIPKPMYRNKFGWLNQIKRDDNSINKFYI